MVRAAEGNSLGSEPEALAARVLRLRQPMAMKPISAGSFVMGGNGIAEPAHRVSLSAFYLLETPVAGANPSYFQSGGDAALRPVETVSWNDAVRFCNALSRLAGLDSCYAYSKEDMSDAVCDFAKNGYRLPTEAEFEYACRAGSATVFWWGDDAAGMNDRIWWKGNSGKTTHPAATKLPNAWGLFDMAGNVWEWCNDWYAPYDSAAQADPIGPSAPDSAHPYPILRGGSFNNDDFFQSASRGFDRARDFAGGTIGFRCARR